MKKNKTLTNALSNTSSESKANTLSEIESLPKEVLELIFSFLTPKDLANVTQVNSLFKYIAQTPAIWRNLTQNHFSYLMMSKPKTVQLQPKETFLQEYFRWKNAATELNMDVKTLLAALNGQDVQTPVNDEDKTIIDLLKQAGRYIRGVLPASTAIQGPLKALLQELLPKSFPGEKCVVCPTSSGRKGALVVGLSNVWNRHVSTSLLNQLFQSYLIAESPHFNSIFNKLKKLTVQELKELKTALSEMVVMLCDFSELTSAQQALVQRFDFNEKDLSDFRDFCGEFFTDDFETFFAKGKKFESKTFYSSDQFLSYLAQNSLSRFYFMVDKKIDQEINLKQQKTSSKVITLSFNAHKNSSGKENANVNDASVGLASKRPPRNH